MGTFNAAASSATVVAGWDGLALISSTTESDDFTGGSLNARWTSWDPASHGLVTLDHSDSILKMTHASNAADKFGGILQPDPNGETAYNVDVRLNLSASTAGDGSVGIIIGDDLIAAPTTANFAFAYVGVGTGAIAAGMTYWTDYLTWAGSAGAIAGLQLFSPAFLRASVATGGGGTVSVSISDDGESWLEIVAATSFAALGITSVACIGIAETNKTGLALVATFRQFSVVYTADKNASVGAWVS